MDRGQGGRITSTYTFNGAGVGTINAGHTLNEVVNAFKTQRNADNSALFTSSVARDFYANWRTRINGDASSSTLAVALFELKGSPTPTEAVRVELELLYSAISRSKAILDEALRVRSGIANGGGGADAQPVAPHDIAAISLDYQLAVLQAKKNTLPYASTILDGLGAAYAEDRAPRT